MRVLTGTSGFSYPHWKGPFYPADAKDDDLLRLYGEQLGTVEINNTFYRIPRDDVLHRWAAAVPDDFSFATKASQRITHKARLVGAEDSLAYLWQRLQALGDKCGPVLFQLPPYLRCDLERLRAFVALLPAGMRAVFEFRHASWNDAEVHALLRGAGAALCVTDTEDGDAEPPLVATADFGYLRLRRADYDAAQLEAWAQRIAAQPWREAFVFFKHEDDGAAPRLARALAARCAAS